MEGEKGRREEGREREPVRVECSASVTPSIQFRFLWHQSCVLAHEMRRGNERCVCLTPRKSKGKYAWPDG